MKLKYFILLLSLSLSSCNNDHDCAKEAGVGAAIMVLLANSQGTELSSAAESELFKLTYIPLYLSCEDGTDN